MAVFLTLDSVEGESRDAHHAKAMDLTAWSLGVTNTASGHSGGGGGAGRATFTDLAVTKVFDRATPALMLAAATGRHLRSGRLSVTSGGPRPLDYLVIDLEDVLVTGCLLADTVEPERPAENVTLSYGKIHVAYTMQSPAGGVGSVAEMAWDVVRNTTG